MDRQLVELLRLRQRPPRGESRTDLIVCSLCLRVLRGSKWVDADQVIRELRSYELETLPRLHAAVCDFCAESIFSSREAAREQVAA